MPFNFNWWSKFLWIKNWFNHFLTNQISWVISQALLLGLVSGLAAIVLKKAVGWLGAWRILESQSHIAWLILPTVGLLGGLIAGTIINQTSSDTKGSGIPQLKQFLAGFGITLNFKIALIKLLATIFTLASGQPIGPEGPTVQIGAALATEFNKIVPTSPKFKKMLVASGAGAGLAAVFNTPLTAFIFVIEELLENISKHIVLASISASLMAAIVSKTFGGTIKNHLDQAITDLTKIEFFTNNIPHYILLGVVAALLAILFIKTSILFIKINQLFNIPYPFRIGITGLICGLVISQLPPEFWNNDQVRTLILFQTFSWQFLLGTLIAYLFLISICVGSGSPGGVFAPVLMLGFFLGHLLSLFYNSDQTLVYTMTMIGGGAFFTAVFRTPITAIILIVEMYHNFNLIIPLMISCITSLVIVNKINPGSIYDQILAFQGINLKHTTNSQLAKFIVSDAMESDIITLSIDQMITDAIDIFSKSNQWSIPIVRDNLLLGIITQGDIMTWQNPKIDPKIALEKIMTPNPITIEVSQSLDLALQLLHNYDLRSIPVLSQGKLVGLITRKDLIRIQAQLFSSN